MIVVEGNSDKFSFSRLFRIEEKKKKGNSKDIPGIFFDIFEPCEFDF